MNQKYRMAATETLDVLAHTESEAVKKIPIKFIDFLKENALEDYKPVLDHSKPMYEMDIMDETKGLLGVIYRHWWASEEEKEQIRQEIRKRRIEEYEEARRKYNPDDLFKKHKKL